MKNGHTNDFISELLPVQELSWIIEETGAGLELISFSVAENLDRLPQTLRETKERLHTLGDPACTVHGPFLDLNPMSYDSKIRRATLERFEQAWEAAAEVGAKALVFHSGMIPSIYYTEGWAERVAAFFEEFLEGKNGIPVCMENVLDREIAPLLEVAERVTHPSFGLCLDLGHAHCYGGAPVTEFAKRLSPYVRHVHVHDNHGIKDEHLGLGEGTLPWKECVRILQQVPKERTWTVECADREGALGSLALLRKMGSNAPEKVV